MYLADLWIGFVAVGGQHLQICLDLYRNECIVLDRAWICWNWMCMFMKQLHYNEIAQDNNCYHAMTGLWASHDWRYPCAETNTLITQITIDEPGVRSVHTDLMAEGGDGGFHT